MSSSETKRPPQNPADRYFLWRWLHFLRPVETDGSVNYKLTLESTVITSDACASSLCSWEIELNSPLLSIPDVSCILQTSTDGEIMLLDPYNTGSI